MTGETYFLHSLRLSQIESTFQDLTLLTHSYNSKFPNLNWRVKIVPQAVRQSVSSHDTWANNMAGCLQRVNGGSLPILL